MHSGTAQTPSEVMQWGEVEREKRHSRGHAGLPGAYLVKALRESSSEDVAEADTDDTGGCSAENRFKLVALGRKESARGCWGE